MSISQTTLTGAAGEHYVMAQLLRYGYVAALAPAGVPTADIVVTDSAGQMTAAVQVKTKTTKGGWILNQKHEKIIGPRLFYVFCDFATEPPECYVLPSSKVAEVVTLDHAKWLNTPGRKGQRHIDNPRRILRSAHPAIGLERGWLEPYRNNWDLLSI